MMAELQSAVVTLLDVFRERYPVVPDGLLVPEGVRPYGGELLDYNRLVSTVPMVFVELETGRLTTQSERTGSMKGAHRPSVLCCARNYAGPEATAHDGARLMSWVVAACQHAGLKVEANQVGAIDYERIVSDSKVWVGQLHIDLSRAKHSAPVPVQL